MDRCTSDMISEMKADSESEEMMEAALEAKVKGGLTHMPWVDEYLLSDKVRYVE